MRVAFRSIEQHCLIAASLRRNDFEKRFFPRAGSSRDRSINPGQATLQRNLLAHMPAFGGKTDILRFSIGDLVAPAPICPVAESPSYRSASVRVSVAVPTRKSTRL
jgi:hypothetical protein